MRRATKQPKAKTGIKKLKVNKQTVKDLDARTSEQVKGGVPKRTVGVMSECYTICGANC
jgi:hypothetical protein